MNTFTIYQRDSMLFNRICENPPSLVDICFIQETLNRSKFSSIAYYIDIIHANKHSRLHEHFESVDEFMKDFINLCNGKFKFGVVLYLN